MKSYLPDSTLIDAGGGFLTGRESRSSACAGCLTWICALVSSGFGNQCDFYQTQAQRLRD